jgi:group I intron endonuclease
MPDFIMYPTKKRISGVYEIYCSASQASYIGSARCLAKRKINHLALLRNGKHTSIHFQRAWDKYGEESFDFRVIEFCDADSLLEREQYYLDTLCPKLNVSKVAGASFKGRHHTAESRLKISIKGKERMRKGGPAITNLIKKLTGRKVPPEVVAKSAASNTGKKRSDITKNRISKSNQGKKRVAGFGDILRALFVERTIKAERDGRTIGKNKFTSEQVREIRTLCDSGLQYIQVAERYGVAPTTIRSIHLRLSYKHVS